MAEIINKYHNITFIIVESSYLEHQLGALTFDFSSSLSEITTPLTNAPHISLHIYRFGQHKIWERSQYCDAPLPHFNSLLIPRMIWAKDSLREATFWCASAAHFNCLPMPQTWTYSLPIPRTLCSSNTTKVWEKQGRVNVLPTLPYCDRSEA